ncbi:MAG: hypothetical protein ACXIUL_02540 [Wenzhouxiangella sp.]
MDKPPSHPIDAIDTDQILSGLDLNWLTLTPFPAPVVIFGILAGLAVLILAWRQPASRRTYGLIGSAMIALSLVFWLCLAAVILHLLARRGPGWHYRNR